MSLTFLHITKIVSEYDQEIPQSQTADNPKARFSYNETYLATIGTASANSAEFLEIRPPMFIEDLI